MSTRTSAKPSTAPSSTKRNRTRPVERFSAWANRHIILVFLGPATVFVMALLVAPLVFVIYLSVTDAGGAVSAPKTFTGLENYISLLTDTERFWPAVIRTLGFAVPAVTIELIAGLGIALLLKRKFRGQSVVRTLILMPVVTAPVAVGMAWLLILQPTVGFANEFLSWFGISPQEWVSSPSQALATLVMIDVWEWTPFMVFILLAGLMVLPEEPYEAARVDGASHLQTFRFITLPMLTASIVTALILRSVDALKWFDTIYIMKGQGGGSLNEAETLNILAYTLNFQHHDYGRASAVLMLFFFLIVMYVYVLVLVRKRWSVTL